MIFSEKIELVVRFSYLAVGVDKGWIPLHCLFQQIDCRYEVILWLITLRRSVDLAGCANIEIKGGDIFRGRLFYLVLLVRKNFGLQLISDGFGDFTLNGEHISKVAIVSLRPKMCVGSRVDQLRVYPDPVRGALHAAFEKMSDA